LATVQFAFPRYVISCYWLQYKLPFPDMSSPVIGCSTNCLSQICHLLLLAVVQIVFPRYVISCYWL